MNMFLLVMSILMVSHTHATETSLLMKAKKVNPSDYPEVVLITSSAGQCTATLVGPSVLLTAGHCAEAGKKVSFTLNGKKYKAQMTVSDLYDVGDANKGLPGLDLALGLIEKEVSGVAFASIGGTPIVGDTLTLLGYGCSSSYKSRGKTYYVYDSKLRMGESEITEIDGYELVLKKTNGAHICMGDSGGPSFDLSSGKRTVVGVHSLADLVEMSIEASTSTAEAISFFKTFISDHNVEICGVNISC